MNAEWREAMQAWPFRILFFILTALILVMKATMADGTTFSDKVVKE